MFRVIGARRASVFEIHHWPVFFSAVVPGVRHEKKQICLSSARRVQLVGWRVKMFGISQPQRGKLLLLLSSVGLYFCALQQDFNPNRSAGTLSQT